MNHKIAASILLSLFILSALSSLPLPSELRIFPSLLPASHAAVVAQSQWNSTTSCCTVFATFAGNTGLNHIILVYAVGMACNTIVPSVTSVTDSQGNSFTNIGANDLNLYNAASGCPSGGGISLVNEVWYAKTSAVSMDKVKVVFNLSALAGTGARGVAIIETDQSGITVNQITKSQRDTTCAATCTISLANTTATNANNFFASTMSAVSGTGISYCEFGAPCFATVGLPIGGMYKDPSGSASTAAQYTIPATTYAYCDMLLDITLTSTLVQPIKVTMANSAPSSSLTIEGCNASPSTMKANNTVANISMDSPCSFFLTFSAGNSTLRYGFNNSGYSLRTANHTSDGVEWDLTAYLQSNYTVKYAVDSGSPTAPNLSGQYLGAANVTALQIPAYTTRWLDYGAAWSVTNPITSGFEQWTSANTTSGNVNGAKAGTFYYVHAWLNFVFHVKFTKPDANPWALTVPYFTFYDGLLSANRTVALTTSYVTYQGRNNTGWNTTNPFFFDNRYWTPDTPSGTLAANNTYINITYNGTASACGTDPFVDLIAGCWWGTVIYTITPVMGNFGLGLIIMSISLALYLKTENPLIPILIMIASGGVLGGAVVTKVLPDFYFPLTAIFLTLGISGGVYQLVRNK